MSQPRRKKQKGRSDMMRNPSGLSLRFIAPKTHAQREVFEYWMDNHLMLHGFPGTGKTFCAMYLALKEVLEHGSKQRIVIIRSAVQGRNQGFLPGTLEEKMAPYEQPYRDTVNDLCGRGDAYELLKQKGQIEFMSTSFLRSLTLENSVLVVDEFQNMTDQELHTVITRVGENTKLAICGDIRQDDLKQAREQTGAALMRDIVHRMPDFAVVEFLEHDIVRSKFVKDYILARASIEDERRIKR